MRRRCWLIWATRRGASDRAHVIKALYYGLVSLIMTSWEVDMSVCISVVANIIYHGLHEPFLGPVQS